MKLPTTCKLLSAGCLLLPYALLAYGQNCYYPNGALANTDDHPCSTDGHSTCCPLNWQCLSNGLCFLPSEGYLGRYTCTDSSWQSDKCPKICLYGMYPYSFGRSYLIMCQMEPPLGTRLFNTVARTATAAMPIVLKSIVAKRPMTSSRCRMGPWSLQLVQIAQKVLLPPKAAGQQPCLQGQLQGRSSRPRAPFPLPQRRQLCPRRTVNPRQRLQKLQSQHLSLHPASFSSPPW